MFHLFTQMHSLQYKYNLKHKIITIIFYNNTSIFFIFLSTIIYKDKQNYKFTSEKHTFKRNLFRYSLILYTLKILRQIFLDVI